MNTQLAEQQAQPLPMHEVIALMQASYNEEVVQNDLLIDAIERLENENTFLKLQVQNLTTRVDTVISENEQLLTARKNDESELKAFNKKVDLVQANAEKQLQMIEQAKRQEQQAKNKLNDALITVAKYKELGSPKKIREQRKDYQGRIEKLQKADNQHRVDAKSYRHDVTKAKAEAKEFERRLLELDMIEVYNKGGDHCWIFPKTMQITKRDMKEREVCMLYLNDSGRGALMTIDEDGELSMGEAPKGGLRPKAETKEHISMLLRMFRKDGGVIHLEKLPMTGVEH